MDPRQTTELVLQLAREAGFERAGVAALEPIGRTDFVHRWLDEGRHGEMHYLARQRESLVDPRRLLPGARFAVVVAESYRTDETPQRSADSAADRVEPDQPRGRVARYAWGRDYHEVLGDKLRGLVETMRTRITLPFEARVCVDAAPLIERELAAAAGIGWIGKNTLVLSRQLGSYTFLGEVLTTLELVPSAPATDHCGSCRRCLEACPTQAFPAPYEMDPRRCIAYLTIEHRGPIEPDLQSSMGDWVFGCDVCQEVCPFNRKAERSPEPAYAASPAFPLAPRPRITELMGMSDDDRRQRLAGSAMMRAKLPMLHRNAAIAWRNLTGTDPVER